MADALRVDVSSATRGFAELGRQGHVLMGRVLRRGAQAANTFFKRSIATDMGVTQTVVNKALSTTVRLDEGVARIQATGSRIPLIAFKARGPEPSRGRGRVTYDLGQGRKTLPGGFIATVGTGRHRGVFVRKGKARLPIREAFGPSVVHVFGKLLPEAADVAQEAMVKSAAHEWAFAHRRMP